MSYLLVDYFIIARRLASVGEDEPHPASGLAIRRRAALTLDDETISGNTRDSTQKPPKLQERLSVIHKFDDTNIKFHGIYGKIY